MNVLSYLEAPYLKSLKITSIVFIMFYLRLPSSVHSRIALLSHRKSV